MTNPTAKQGDVVEGEIIDAFVFKRIGFNLFEFQWKSILVYLIVYLLACCAVWSWWNGNLRGDLDLKLVLCVLVIPLAVLIRALGAFFQLRRGERLVLGKDRFQQTTKKGQVLIQIPYRNIARMELINEPGKEKFIGIELKDLSDADTLRGDDEEFGNRWGWHHRITDAWSMPLQQIHQRLRKRLSHP